MERRQSPRRRRPSRVRLLMLVARHIPGLDPALKTAGVAVAINVVVRLMEAAFANPWDPMIQNALGFYTVWTLVRIISGATERPTTR